MKKTQLPLFLILLLSCVTSCQNSKVENGLYESYLEEVATSPLIDEKAQGAVKLPIKVKPQADLSGIPDYEGGVSSISFSQANITQPYVALTFDDGPHAVHTIKILDVLKKYNAKATFFVLGSNVKRYPNILRRIANEGHEVANHSWNHPFFTKLNAAQLRKQLGDTNYIIKSITGQKVHSMRPPYGATNKRINALMANQYGLTSIMWSVDPADWKRPGVQVVVNRVLSKTRPGSVILLHDIHASSAQAVEPIVRGLIQKGYKFVTVNQLRSIARQEAKSATQALPATSPTPSQSVQPSLQKAMQMGGY